MKVNATLSVSLILKIVFDERQVVPARVLEKKKIPSEWQLFLGGGGGWAGSSTETNIFLRSAQLHSHKIVLILATLLKFHCQICCLILCTRSVLCI